MEQRRYSIIINMLNYMDVIPFDITDNEFRLISEMVAWLRSGNYGSLEIIKGYHKGEIWWDLVISNRKRLNQN